MRWTILLITILLSFSAVSTELTEKQKSAIKAAVGMNLLDEDSAKYKFPEVKDKVYCGLVNDKNQSGEYAGSQVFKVVLLSSDSVLFLGLDSADSQALSTSCAQKGYNLADL